MKKKLILLLLSVIFVCSMTGVIGISAAEELPVTLEVANVNYSSDWNGVLLSFAGTTANTSNFAALDATKIEYKNAAGDAITATPITLGTHSLIQLTGATVTVGDTLTVKEGFYMLTNETVAEDVTYVYKTADSPWVLYADEVSLEVANVNYSSDWNGVLISFEGTTANASNFAALDATKIEYKNAAGDAVTATVITLGTHALIQLTGATVTVGDTVTVKEGFYMLTNETVVEDITYVYQTAGTSWIVYSNEIPIEQCKDLTIADAYCFTDNTWGAPTIQFNFGTSSAGGFAQYQGFDTSFIEYKNFFGEIINVIDMTSVGTTYFISRLGDSMANPYVPMVGDTITFKQNMRLHPDEALKANVTYVVTSAFNNPCSLFTAAPTAVTVTGNNLVSIGATTSLTTSIEPAGTYGTPRFTSSDEGIATVSSKGVVTGVAEGEVTITAYLSETIEDTITVTVLPAKAITGIELVGVYDYYVVKDATFDLSTKVSMAKLEFEDGSYSPEFEVTADDLTYSVDTSTVGTKNVDVAVDFEGTTYTKTINVVVYELYDQQISEIGIVDWFSYAIFVQFPNTSTNRSNLTIGTMIPGILDYLSYTRADGTEMTISGYYILNENLALLMSFKDENGDPVTLTAANYNNYFLAGDILTFEAGMMMYKWTGLLAPTSTDNGAIAIGTGEAVIEGTLPATVQYRYNGNVWGIYIEYTDISVKDATKQLKIGETSTTGVTRNPSNATTGTFTYASSNTAVATVSANGVITAVGEGTATVTVELDGGLAGKKTATVEVVVSDYIKELSITPNTVTVKKGGELSLSDLTAKFAYASGTLGDTVDLTGATISGFNSSDSGEQIVIITVTVGGKSYSGKITVTVEGGRSCSSSTAAATGILALLTLLGAAMLKKL